MQLYDQVKDELKRQLWLAWDGLGIAALGWSGSEPPLPSEAAGLSLIVTCADLVDDTAFAVVDIFHLEIEGFLHPLRLPFGYGRIEVSLVEISGARPSEGFDFRIEPIVCFALDRNLSRVDGGRLVYATGTANGRDLLGVVFHDVPEILEREAIETFLSRRKRYAAERPSEYQPLAFAIVLPSRADDAAGAGHASISVGPCETLHPGGSRLVAVDHLPVEPERPPSDSSSYPYTVWKHTVTVNPTVSLVADVPSDQDAGSLSGLFAAQVLMQRRLATWWEDQLKAADEVRKHEASQLRMRGSDRWAEASEAASGSSDSLVHINFSDLARLPINVAADVVPPPIEPGEAIVVLPLEGKADKLAIAIGEPEMIESEGKISRYRIDFQMASRGDYVAVVDRYRERLASLERLPTRFRAFRVGRTELVPAELSEEIKRDLLAYLILEKERERRSLPAGPQGQEARDREAIRTVVEQPVVALMRLAHQRLTLELSRRGLEAPAQDEYEEDPSACTAAVTGVIAELAAADHGLRNRLTLAKLDFAEEPRFFGRALARSGFPAFADPGEPASLALEFNLFRLYGMRGKPDVLNTLLSACASYPLKADATFQALQNLAREVEAFFAALANDDVQIEIAGNVQLQAAVSAYLARRDRGEPSEAEDFSKLRAAVMQAAASARGQRDAVDADQEAQTPLGPDLGPRLAARSRAELVASLNELLTEALKAPSRELVAAAEKCRQRLLTGQHAGIVYITRMIGHFGGQLEHDDRRRKLVVFCEGLCSWAGLSRLDHALTPEELMKLFEEVERDLAGSGAGFGQGFGAGAPTDLARQIERAEHAAVSAFHSSVEGTTGFSGHLYADLERSLPRLVRALGLHRAYHELETLRASAVAAGAGEPPVELKLRLRIWPLDAARTWESHADWARNVQQTTGGKFTLALPELTLPAALAA